jgi:rhodanese-related sulfurtransferase
MNDTIQFLIRHGGFLLFSAMLVEGLGLPIPAIPWLLAAGALSRTNQLNPFLALSAAMLACLIADSAWFVVGRFGGNRALRFLCRISLEPDSCVRRTQNIFERFGMRAVLAAKFLPGVPTDRELVLYCSCPNEASSARVACFLRRNGIEARPLLGGIDAWRQAQYPTERWRPSGLRTPLSTQR